MPRLRRAKFACVCIFVGAVVAATTATAHAAPAAKLIGGAKVDRPTFDARWRSVVRVEPRSPLSSVTDQGEPCIGVLVSQLLVLTREDCALSSTDVPVAQYLRVRGATKRISGGTRQYGGRVDVAEVIRNPRGSTLANGQHHDHREYVLLRLASPIAGAVPIRLAQATDAALWGSGAGRTTGVFAASWHPEYSDDDDDYSSERRITTTGTRRPDVELSAVELPVLSTTTCRTEGQFAGRSALTFDAETQLCVGASKPKLVNACSQDDGGPLIAIDGAAAPVLLGMLAEGSYECENAAIVDRTAVIQPWVDVVRAEVDAGRPGPAAATSLAATQHPNHRIRLTWSSTDPSVVQQVVARSRTIIERYPDVVSAYPSKMAAILATQTDSVYRFGLVAGGVNAAAGDGLTPVTADPRRRATFAVIVEDGLGRTTVSDPLRVQPQIDSEAPTRPTKLRSKLNRYGVPSITWSSSSDNDCIDTFELEYSRLGSRRWEYQDDRYPSGYECGRGNLALPDEDYPFDIGMFERTPGWYRVRIVAIDRAGNRSRSTPISVYVPRDIQDLDLDDECDLRGERVLCNYPIDDFEYDDYEDE